MHYYNLEEFVEKAVIWKSPICCDFPPMRVQSSFEEQESESKFANGIHCNVMPVPNHWKIWGKIEISHFYKPAIIASSDHSG